MPCPYCKAGLERVLPPRQDDDDDETYSLRQPQIIIHTSSVAIPPATAGNVAAATTGAAACSGVAMMLFIFMLVGGILAAVFLFDPFSPVTVNPPPLQIHDPFVLIPSADDGPADVVAMSYDLNEETYAIGRLSLAQKQFLWRATPVASISDVRQLAANDTTLFLVEEETTLKALNLADGSLLWQSELADKIGYGDKPLQVGGNHVFAMTQDYTLQAFAAATGSLAWSRRMAGYTSNFTLLTDSVAFLDEADDKTSLFFLNLADGSERARLTPYCERPDSPGWGSELYSSSPFFFEPGLDGRLDSGAVYFFYGSSPTCIERWNLADFSLAWQSVNEENLFSWSGDLPVVITPADIYFSYNDQLWVVSQTTREHKLLLENEDYFLAPLVRSGDTLLVLARRTRGSERFELWAINPASGAQIWSKDLGDSNPFFGPYGQVGSFSSGDSAWDWQLSGDQLVRFIAAADPNQFSIEWLNLSDGTVAQTFTTPIETWSEDSYWMDAGIWKGPRYWANVETKLYAVNINSGEIQYRYP
jgi:outer membrane protein assembly factor BamB